MSMAAFLQELWWDDFQEGCLRKAIGSGGNTWFLQEGGDARAIGE